MGRNGEFGLAQYFSSYFPSDVIHAIKSYDVGPPVLLPLRRKWYCRFLSLLNSIASAGFELANLGFNGKHDNHYTTEATLIGFTL
jgi:hypothetical protein